MNVTKTTIIAILAVVMATLISVEGAVVEGGAVGGGTVEGGVAVEGGLRKTRILEWTWEGTKKKWDDFWDEFWGHAGGNFPI
jgi:hypothetical protein